jgi:GNAT superfamily N-acetyltransferase
MGINMARFNQHPQYAPVTIVRCDNSMAWCIQDDEVIYMANVWVHPDVRGTGIGMKMMAEIREQYPDAHITTDYTEESQGFWNKVFEAGYVDEVVNYRYNFDWINGRLSQPTV